MPNLPTGTVTLLFTDIEGSTLLLKQLGDRYASVLTECRRLLREAFQRWNGHEVDTQGDAFFVAFGRATDAVSAAIDAQRLLTGHSWPEGVAVRVRMGLHTGEPSLTPEGYVGLDVHAAARIMSAGHGGQVLISQTTRDLVAHDLQEGVSLRDMGEHRLKDVERPSHLFQLVIKGLPADFPPLKSLNSNPHNLPVQPTPLIGREWEVTAVCELLRRADVRLLSLTGPAGVGKTRLGLHVADQLSALFPDGVFLVTLALVRDTASVLPAIAQTLGVSEAGDQPVFERLKASLRDKQFLLLLDNFEQVVAAAIIVADLLAACPGLKVLVTSRVALHVRAEHVFPVSPLAAPDMAQPLDTKALAQYASIALFIQRAQAAKSDFQMTEANAPAIAGICARLDGLPLAIELAAARSKYLSPQSLLARLEQGLAILTGGARDLPERQQTLRGAIAWSYELLDSEEQKLFRRLAIFVDGCTLEAVEQVCIVASELQGEVLEILEALVDKSLLRQEEQAKGEVRFWMLQTLREFGLECLSSLGEAETTRDAHAAYYLALAMEAAPHLTGAEQAWWLDHLEQEHENLRAALEWTLERAGMRTEHAEQALQLCIALLDFWETRGYFREGRAFLERALASSEGSRASLRAEALYAAGFMAIVQDEGERAEVLLHKGLALFRAIENKSGIAKSLRMLANLARVRNTYRTARSLLEEALMVYRELGNKMGIASTREDLAQVATSQGDYSRARALLEANLARFNRLDEKYSRAYPLYHLARVLFVSQGDQAKALALADESLVLFREVGNKRFIGYVLSLLGQILLLQGERSRARELSEESLAIIKDVGERFGVAESLIFSARVADSNGNAAAARAYYKESAAILREIDAKELSSACLEGWGEVLVEQDKPTWAVRLWGTAATIRAAIGAPMPPVNRAPYERAVSTARTRLGQEAFTAAWAEGRQTPPGQALLLQD